ncbi:hypothetical protein [Polynucleobacter arcticus]|nr:hypothetical protein [Polynucleobacter arcticus]
MNALFLSKFTKQLRAFIALSFLLVSLLGTHWIGFAHGISHSGIQQHAIELSCLDQTPALGHDSVGCHLFDALTLAGFVASTTASFAALNSITTFKPLTGKSVVVGIQVGLYQSRAPPTFIL